MREVLRAWDHILGIACLLLAAGCAAGARTLLDGTSSPIPWSVGVGLAAMLTLLDSGAAFFGDTGRVRLSRILAFVALGLAVLLTFGGVLLAGEGLLAVLVRQLQTRSDPSAPFFYTPNPRPVGPAFAGTWSALLSVVALVVYMALAANRLSRRTRTLE